MNRMKQPSEFSGLICRRIREAQLFFILVLILICLITICEAGSMQDLGTLGGNSSWGYGINDTGEVVGKSEFATGNTHTHAFLYSGAIMHDLGTFNGGTSSEAHGINNWGNIAGWGDLSSPTAISHCFLYSDGVMKDIGSLGGNFCNAYAINDAEQITGYSTDIQGHTRAFIYSGGSMIDIGNLTPSQPSRASYGYAINNYGDVAGTVEISDSSYHAFVYSNSVMYDLGTLGGVFSEAHGINDKGEVAGWSMTVGGQMHAFLYSGGVMHDLGTFSGSQYSSSHAYAVDYQGQVAGDSTNPGHAFLYSDGVMTDLGSLRMASDASGAYAINNAGQVTGWSYGGFGYLIPHAFFYSRNTFPPVYVIERGYYDHLRDGYANAPETCTIMAQGIEFSENFTADYGKIATIRGGYDGMFSSNSGFTTIIGAVTISTGTVTLENVIVR